MTQDLSKNANRFIIFSVFYTARSYYPVLAILFLDLGLSLDQFVLLNLVWAATIFLFEVPSGALADTIGRRKLLIAASVLMIVEMTCLLFAPRDGGVLLLVLCTLNRICSGLSEACASGADEAIAYDSLPKENRTAAWDSLLSKAMRWRSAGFVIAMIIGGLLYDPKIINFLLPASFQLTSDLVHRLPVALVLLQAFVCLVFTLRMVEPANQSESQHTNRAAVKSTVANTIRLTLNTARWVVTNRVLLVAILIGVAIDSITRNFATINSSYFRMIELPEWTYGFIGAIMGVLSWFVPAIAKRLNERFSMLANLGFTAATCLIGLIVIIPMWPIYGVLPAIFLMTMMGFLSFTISRVLHQEADSSRRATVLSVKGLVFNFGYGIFSLGFSGLLAYASKESKDIALQQVLMWQVPYFTILIVALFVWATFYLKREIKV
ncbi:MAG: MFS transporter [Gammaproteobacteria bacterium]|nr:MAG: MFS transporter [Gammaproteobacteria bacterium]